MMTYIFLFVTAVPVFALAFTAVTCLLGVFSDFFRPQEATFYELYRGYLIIAAVFVVVGYVDYELMEHRSLFLMRRYVPGTFTFMAVTAAYRRIFDATWVHAVVIGVIGGILGALVWIKFLDYFA